MKFSHIIPAFVIGFMFAAYAICSYGYVMTSLWNWHVVPLAGVPRLDWRHVAGAYGAFRLLLPKSSTAELFTAGQYVAGMIFPWVIFCVGLALRG